jgi:hypothetical protein
MYGHILSFAILYASSSRLRDTLNFRVGSNLMFHLLQYQVNWVDELDIEPPSLC